MGAKSSPGVITLFSSAARTASPSNAGPYRRQGMYRGGVIQINVTAVTSTPSVVFTVQDQSGVVADWADVIASAAITGTGTTNIVLHPDAVDTANLSENTQVGSAWRLKAVHADADSITYSVKFFPIA